MSLISMLKRHEGFRKHPYLDTLGFLTVGYGYNLDSLMEDGISEKEAVSLLETRVSIIREEAARKIPGWDKLLDARQDVIIDMIYNMGITRFFGFKRMLSALEAQDYDSAADEMLDSRWAEQVGGRALELSEMMRLGRHN